MKSLLDKLEEMDKNKVTQKLLAEKLSDLLFEKYQKDRRAVKEGEAFPVWFDHNQLKWIQEVIEENYLNNISK